MGPPQSTAANRARRVITKQIRHLRLGREQESSNGASCSVTRAPAQSKYGDLLNCPLIGDYAIIGDCRTVALVSREGSIDWLCLPDLSSPSVFAGLLDKDRGGRFSISPLHPCRIVRRYLPDTNVLETEFHAKSGIARLTDFLPILANREWKAELQPAREVLRVVECLAGTVELTVRFEPRTNYGRGKQTFDLRGPLVWKLAHRDEVFLLHCSAPLEWRTEEAAEGVVRLACGEKRYFSLSYAKSDIAVLPLLADHAERKLEATVEWWRSWARQCRHEGPYREYVVRSALVLKLLTFAPSGAVIAAPTTSLPEQIGGSLNWDYRFCWLRDAQFTLTAFVDLGFNAEAQAYLSWLLYSTRLTQPRLQVLYDVYGETRLPEKELSHLPDYRNSRPVRIGNDAFRQVQLDVYGSVIAAADAYVGRGGRLGRSGRKLLVGFGREVCRSWQRPDHSIWEVRGPRRQYTYSKLMCWVALDRLLRLYEKGLVDLPEASFRKQSNEIRFRIESDAFDDDLQSYTGVLGEQALDSSLLLMATLGFEAASSPRMRSTFARLTASLGDGALLRRYDEQLSRTAEKEGSFGACGFWAVEYLTMLGEVEQAYKRFEQLLAYGNDLGLFSEETDGKNGRALGNFPQALTHASLINAALALARLED